MFERKNPFDSSQGQVDMENTSNSKPFEKLFFTKSVIPWYSLRWEVKLEPANKG